ncbi:DMT family transporter [Dactylosporangium sp. NPDC051485]|uniref:DMT family transporter n=1 Tax=Dactylosporangium sp. NPDC051485 TaxID=3154846 RepID=UPI003432CA16
MAPRRAIGLAAAGLGGIAVAVQSRINGALAGQLHHPGAAAVLSFCTGLLLLLVVVAATRRGRQGLAGVRDAVRAGTLQWWHCLGGVLGAYLVVIQSLTVTVLGVAAFTVAAVAGQAAGGLLLDRSGAAPTGPQPVTPARAAGAALAVTAVLITVAGQLTRPQSLPLLLLPVAAGAGMAWQQAANGRVRVTAGGAGPAALVSFAAGAVVLLFAFGIAVLAGDVPSGGLPTSPWMYLGGPLGVAFIAIAAAVVRHTGVLLLGLAMTVGQLTGAVVLDTVTPVPSSGGPSASMLTGVGLTILATLIAAAGRPKTAPQHTPRSRR